MGAEPGRTPRLAWRDLRVPLLAGVVVVGAAVALVASSLRRPELPTFVPTERVPEEVGDRRVGPDTITVDAGGREWVFFDFSSGAVVDEPGPLEWDLAFRRFHVIANGGPGFAGQGGALDLGPASFDSVQRVPEDGYRPTEARGDSVNEALGRWYDYGWSTHVLTPKERVWAVRTADGRYAKLAFLGYYCPGARPGCVTFRYVYAGEGGTLVTSSPKGGAAGAERDPAAGRPGSAASERSPTARIR